MEWSQRFWDQLQVIGSYHDLLGFPDDVEVKNLPGDVRGASSIPVLGRSPGGGNGTPLQYSCLENSMERGAWRAIVHGVPKCWTWLSDWTYPPPPHTHHQKDCGSWLLDRSKKALQAFLCISRFKEKPGWPFLPDELLPASWFHLKLA